MQQKSILKILTDSHKLFFNSANDTVKTEVDILCDILNEYRRLRKINHFMQE